MFLSAFESEGSFSIPASIVPCSIAGPIWGIVISITRTFVGSAPFALSHAYSPTSETVFREFTATVRPSKSFAVFNAAPPPTTITVEGDVGVLIAPGATIVSGTPRATALAI